MGLDAMGIGAIADFAGKVLDRFVPDPAIKAQAIMEAQKSESARELQQMADDTGLAHGQIEVDKAEAASTSLFVSGWRPFVGWVCGAGFAMIFVVGPLLEWVANLFGHAIKFPILDAATLTTLLFGMLGLGTMRTVEKVKGASGVEPVH